MEPTAHQVLDRLDLNHLVVLNALLEESSVSKAAQRVFLSQPATSWALARLRDYFGDPLLVRHGRRMVLTPMARAMKGPLAELLEQVEHVVSTKPSFDPTTTARMLRIEASDHLLDQVLAPVVADCSRTVQSLCFDIGALNVSSQERLERGEIDFIMAPRSSVSSKHPASLLYRDGYACLACADHPTVYGKLSAAQFHHLGHVATDWLGGLPTALAQGLSGRPGDRRRIEASVPQYTLLARMLVGTPLIATVQRRLAQRLAATTALQVVPLPFKVPEVDEVVQCHRFQERDPMIDWFMTKLKARAASAADPTARCA